MVITRFPPSPTGDPHIGNIRTALFAWAYARAQKGKFFLRIEDTDKSREVPGSVDKILQSLEWLALDYDAYGDQENGIMHQSTRLSVYTAHAEMLLKNGHAYVCTCQPERLQKVRKEQVKQKEPPRYDGHCREAKIKTVYKPNQQMVIRLTMPKEGTTTFTDVIRGRVSFENNLIDDQVLLKSDGYPTYHLANVVDDHAMGVTTVIRGEDWLPSTPKHIVLYTYLGYPIPQFAHLPIIIAKDKAKLSKRHGARSVLEYKTAGYLPEALFNYLALLGWHPKNDTSTEIISRETFLKAFSLERVQKSSALFDAEKLNWMNKTYIHNLTPKELTRKLKKFDSKLNPKLGVVALVQDRMKTLGDFKELSGFIQKLPAYDPDLLIFKKSNSTDTKKALTLSRELVQTIPDKEFTSDRLKHYFNHLIAQNEFAVGSVLHPLRVALTGLANSPGPFESAAVLGKKESTIRIKTALEKCGRA